MIRDHILEIVEREIPKTEAILEMEININEIQESTSQILRQQLGHEQRENDINNFKQFNEKYKKLIQTDKEKELED